MAELLLQEALTQADIEELQDTGVAISAKFNSGLITLKDCAIFLSLLDGIVNAALDEIDSDLKKDFTFYTQTTIETGCINVKAIFKCRPKKKDRKWTEGEKNRFTETMCTVILAVSQYASGGDPPPPVPGTEEQIIVMSYKCQTELTKQIKIAKQEMEYLGKGFEIDTSVECDGIKIKKRIISEPPPKK